MIRKISVLMDAQNTWRLAFVLALLGAWLDGKLNSHWWFLISFGGCALALWNHKRIIAEAEPEDHGTNRYRPGA